LKSDSLKISYIFISNLKNIEYINYYIIRLEKLYQLVLNLMIKLNKRLKDRRI